MRTAPVHADRKATRPHYDGGVVEDQTPGIAWGKAPKTQGD